MLQLIEAADEKAKAQEKLETRLQNSLKYKGILNVGFPGGNDDVQIYSVGDGRLWAGFKKPIRQDIHPRFWNAFGVFKSAANSQTIAVEINIERGGNSGRIAGFFARDTETGDILLMHSGKIGGGQKGVGRTAFLVWSKAKLVEVVRRKGKCRTGIVVARIDSRSFAEDVWYFVQNIVEFKAAVREGATATEGFRDRVAEYERYSKEYSGRKAGGGGARTEYDAIHGKVVQAIYDVRSKRKLDGEAIFNNQLMDLYVRKSRKIVEVYEVKTSLDRQSLYTAIGQLLTHSLTGGSSARRFIVLPQGPGPSKEFTAAFKQVGIEVMRYSESKNGTIRISRRV